VQYWESLGVFAISPRLFRCISKLELNCLGVSIIIFIWNTAVQFGIFVLHTLIQLLKLNIPSSRYPIPYGYLQAIRNRSYLMWHCLVLNIPVQQLLQQVQIVLSQSVWQPGWLHQYNPPYHNNHCTALESPLHILEHKDIISIVESPWIFQKMPILLIRWAGTLNMGRSGLVESS